MLLVAITAFIYFFVTNQRTFLNFFYIPVLLGAYFFGKRYALSSAIFSIIIIGILAYMYPETFLHDAPAKTVLSVNFYRWFDIATWAGFLLVTAVLMGLLYDKKVEANEELRDTYRGIVEMLSLVIESSDNFTQSHSFRVSVIAEMIAKNMELPYVETENIRTAALLHDIGKIGVSSDVLQKITALTLEEKHKIKRHTRYATDVLEPLGNRVSELLPIIVLHHEKYDGTGYYKTPQDDIPLGARIIAVADVYDALTTDRPYRKAFSPIKARDEICGNSGTHFDPEVVRSFEIIFPNIEIEIQKIYGAAEVREA